MLETILMLLPSNQVSLRQIYHRKQFGNNWELSGIGSSWIYIALWQPFYERNCLFWSFQAYFIRSGHSKHISYVLVIPNIFHTFWSFQTYFICSGHFKHILYLLVIPNIFHMFLSFQTYFICSGHSKHISYVQAPSRKYLAPSLSDGASRPDKLSAVMGVKKRNTRLQSSNTCHNFECHLERVISISFILSSDIYYPHRKLLINSLFFGAVPLTKLTRDPLHLQILQKLHCPVLNLYKNYKTLPIPQLHNYFILMLMHKFNGVTFSQFFSTYRWQHDVARSNHVTNPRDHNILLLGTICLFIYNHTKEIEFYLFADWLQDLWGRLQFSFQYIRQRQHDVVRSIDI